MVAALSGVFASLALQAVARHNLPRAGVALAAITTTKVRL
jgi:hypothetical protein